MRRRSGRKLGHDPGSHHEPVHRDLQTGVDRPARAARRRRSTLAIIVLTTFELDEYVFEALRAGASGFLLKDIDPDDLRDAVRIAARGEALLSPSVTRRLIDEFVRKSPSPREPERLGELTAREREVVTLVGEGLSNEEIGARLYMSPATAKTHVSRAMAKLGARDRAQLVVIAYETGLAG